MSTSYLYDGTFAGFLCAVACCLEAGGEPEGFARAGSLSQGGLFAVAHREVVADQGTLRRFRERFQDAVSREAYEAARYAFHSEREGIEMLLWGYLRLGLTVGRRLDGMLAQEPVHSVRRYARQTAREAHRFLGFVRFREVHGSGHTFLYASIEPDADLLEFIVPHFRARLTDRPWMIHDLRRSRAALYDLKGLRLVREVDLAAAPDTTAGEEVFARYWRGYFRHLAIAERCNPSLQRQQVPLKYRKHLVEFGAEGREGEPDRQAAE